MNRVIRNMTAVLVCLALMVCESGFAFAGTELTDTTRSQNAYESENDIEGDAIETAETSEYELGIDADDIESGITATGFRSIVKNNVYLTKNGVRQEIDGSKVEITNIHEQYETTSNDIDPTDDSAIKTALRIEDNYLTISLRTEIEDESGKTIVVSGEGNLRVVETSYNIKADEIEVEVFEEIVSPTGRVIPNRTYEKTIQCLREKVYAYENNKPSERHRIGGFGKAERFKLKIYDSDGNRVSYSEVTGFFEKIRPGDSVNFEIEWFIPEYEYEDDEYDDKRGEYVCIGGRTVYYSSMKRGHSPIKYIERKSKESWDYPDNPDDPDNPNNPYEDKYVTRTVSAGDVNVSYKINERPAYNGGKYTAYDLISFMKIGEIKVGREDIKIKYKGKCKVGSSVVIYLNKVKGLSKGINKQLKGLELATITVRPIVASEVITPSYRLWDDNWHEGQILVKMNANGGITGAKAFVMRGRKHRKITINKKDFSYDKETKILKFNGEIVTGSLYLG